MNTPGKIAAVSILVLLALGSFYFFGGGISEGSHETAGPGPSVAFVVPSFTVAAYHALYSADVYPDSFYQFYKDHQSVPSNVNISDELGLLTSNVGTARSIVDSSVVKTEYRFLSLATQVRNLLSPVSVSILSDEDVDRGQIFVDSSNTTDAYHILILGHQEYVTYNEYANLERFVQNGGSLILVDGNTFIAQVKYNQSADTVSLVNGHGFAFNGKTAWKSVYEYWARENSLFIGSNTCNPLDRNPGFTLGNDPFGYDLTRGEEQCVTNAGVTPILDYQSSNPAKKIWAYQFGYGKGNVFDMGVFGDDLVSKPAFLDFFNKVVTNALQPFGGVVSFKTCTNVVSQFNFVRAYPESHYAGVQPNVTFAQTHAAVVGASDGGGSLGLLVTTVPHQTTGNMLLLNIKTDSQGLVQIWFYDNLNDRGDNYLYHAVEVASGNQSFAFALNSGGGRGDFDPSQMQGFEVNLITVPDSSTSVSVSNPGTVTGQSCH